MPFLRRLLGPICSRARVHVSLFIVLASGCFTPAAQAQSAYSLSIQPSEGSIQQGQCYVMSVTNGFSYTLNLGYTRDEDAEQFWWYFPTLSNSQATICTDLVTLPGTYTFRHLAYFLIGNWVPVLASITITAAPPPPQPTSLSFNPTSAYAGNDCYVMTMGNSANMTVDLDYMFNNVWQSVWVTTMNANGQWPYCVNHYDRVGTYTFVGIKNDLAWSWVSLNPFVTFVVKPPQPTSLTVSPSTILQGQSYSISVGNGANVTLDMQYTLNGSQQTIFTWPTLGGSSPNPDGSVTIATDSATALGKYVFTAVRNTLNTAWFSTASPLTICPSGAPTISSITPSSGVRGNAVSVTITGTNLCSVSLSTTAPGLTFSNINWNAPFTSATATFNIASTAPLGPATVQLTAASGSASAQFSILPPLTLTKEYIYIGGKLVAIERPPQ